MKLVLLFLSFPLIAFVASQTLVFAQSDEEIAAKYAITFPIAELNNCPSLDSCKTFCDDAQNKEVCLNYAKKKGFYQEHQQPTPAQSDEEILNLAKVELGCNTYDQCMRFCDQKDNWKRCEEFAYRHGLSGEEMQKMREAMYKLGCDSPSACMSFCSNPVNMQKCSEIFQSIGVSSNISTEEPPESWCPKAGREGETCSWDGSQCTCWNPQECESYPGCKFTGNSCQCTYQEEPGEVWCPRNPGCSWDGNQCKCSETTTETAPSNYQQEPPEVWCPKAGPYCSWNGSNCICWNPDDCQKSAGCTWTGSKCDCASVTSSENVDFSTQCLQQPGCTWDADSKICSCPVENPQPSQQEQEKLACETDKICYWDGTSCVCPQGEKSVQGVSTKQGLLGQILNFISELIAIK